MTADPRKPMDRIVQLVPVPGGAEIGAFFALDASGEIWYGAVQLEGGARRIEWQQVRQDVR